MTIALGADAVARATSNSFVHWYPSLAAAGPQRPGVGNPDMPTPEADGPESDRHESDRQGSEKSGTDTPVPLSRAPVLRLDRARLLQDFAAALEARDQLRLVYQPQIVLATGQCSGVEALLRWAHPTLGDISPVEFIPVIEEDPLVGQLTDWVLDHAMAFAARMQKSGMDIRVSVNIAPANLALGYLVGRLVELLGSHELRPSMLELEFTERSLIGDDQRTRQQLRQIRRIGLGVAIDDFGAGFSNLGYLRQIPADALKIDKSLMDGVETERHSATIVKWLVGLSHELGLRVVAEGVETEATRALLAGFGCDEGQGYLFARPMQGFDLLRWLTVRGHANPLPEAAALRR